ncbi:MAG: LytR/AlgR family response regulator transcription factor [Thermoanaerobaculia bacterium]
MTEPSRRVLIVDDEPVARRRLKRLLSRYKDITVVDECSGGLVAVERIRALEPDLVFLDIQMPDLDGFGVVAEIGVDQMPSVIFVTAYDQYALRAFDVHAIDYLLKPYDEERFDAALRHAAEINRPAPADDDRLRALLLDMLQRGEPSAAKPTGRYHDRVAVKVDGKTRIIAIKDVDWFETDGNYIRIRVGRASYLIRNTANRLEQELDPRQFARIHRRYLVNLERVVEVEPWFGGDAIVRLKDGAKLKLSRSYRESFHARMLGDHNGGALNDVPETVHTSKPQP